MLEKLKAWARALIRDVLTIYIAARDPRIPLGVKLLALATVAYVFSPIDLIPDIVPILGQLDDIFGIFVVGLFTIYAIWRWKTQ